MEIRIRGVGQIRSDAANGTTSVVADTGAIVDSRIAIAPEADIQGANVVLRAGTSIGAGDALEIDRKSVV